METPDHDPNSADPWNSPAIPLWTRAETGALTPNGSPAVFRSNTHAWIALRLVYLSEVAGFSDDQIEERTATYQKQWERYVRHLEDMRNIAGVFETDLKAAAVQWNFIDQEDANKAFTAMLCEREGFPKVNLGTLAQRHFGLTTAVSATSGRDEKVSPRHHQDAWLDSPNGKCRSCGSPTISQRQHDRLRKTLRSNPQLFNLKPMYQQVSGKLAPLWSARLLIAAKGVADHVKTWSSGGRTSPDNLKNVCSACNYSRNDASLDIMRVAAYT